MKIPVSYEKDRPEPNLHEGLMRNLAELAEAKRDIDERIVVLRGQEGTRDEIEALLGTRWNIEKSEEEIQKQLRQIH